MKRLPKILLSAGALLLIYVFSSGPAVYWVRRPVVNVRSLNAFDRYDKRLRAYFDFYFPIILLRTRSDVAESVLSIYERLFQPRLSPQSGLVLGETYFPAGFYSHGRDGKRPTPKATCDARDLMQPHGIQFKRGYVFYLPRSQILVAEGTQDDIDLFENVVSDGPDLSRYAVFFF